MRHHAGDCFDADSEDVRHFAPCAASALRWLDPSRLDAEEANANELYFEFVYLPRFCFRFGSSQQAAMDAGAFLSQGKAALEIEARKQWDVVTVFPTIDPVAYLHTLAGGQLQALGCTFRGAAKCKAGEQVGHRIRYPKDAHGEALAFSKTSTTRLGRLALLGSVSVANARGVPSAMKAVAEAALIESPSVLILDASLPSNQVEEVEHAIREALSQFLSVSFCHYSYDMFGFPGHGRRSFVVAVKQGVQMPLLKDVLPCLQKLARAKHGVKRLRDSFASSKSACHMYELEMCKRLAASEARPSTEEACEQGSKKRKHSAAAFAQRWLRTEDYCLPKAIADKYALLPKQNELLLTHAAVLCHKQDLRAGHYLTDAASSNWKGLSLSEDVLPELKPTSEVLSLCQDDLRLLMPSEILGVKGYAAISLQMLSPAKQRAATGLVPWLPAACCMLLLSAKMCC